ncbi:hypothetical protein BC833DRAFT_337745, partial [Globomyces pollinis-pini]
TEDSHTTPCPTTTEDPTTTTEDTTTTNEDPTTTTEDPTTTTEDPTTTTEDPTTTTEDPTTTTEDPTTTTEEPTTTTEDPTTTTEDSTTSTESTTSASKCVVTKTTKKCKARATSYPSVEPLEQVPVIERRSGKEFKLSFAKRNVNIKSENLTSSAKPIQVSTFVGLLFFIRLFLF